jgi:pseudouridine-5'-phosphate glycosidase/pseudouridine-5'-phosphate glycosidase/pseudouridine kinase
MALSRKALSLSLPLRAIFRDCPQIRTITSGRDRLFGVSEEVQDALATGKPVVALETTIYTHGTAMSL